ncbi:MAG: chemotaxis protein CheW [Acidothermus cellulolyticus]|jgi:purine-binding chemotaxis protein CheW|nr:chemotaxis protein CheW [Acidothermus cellulolyticus]MCL6550940.1 chemotaxis protein CheW [Acidothermus cellulolyticus]
MSVTQFTTFYVDAFWLGVEVHRVQEVIRHQEMTPVPLAPHGTAGLINLRGEVVTAIDVRTRFGLPPLPEDATPMNVVVRVDDEPISLLVDAIGDVENVRSEQFEMPPETLTGAGRAFIRGAYKMDGRLLLALDVDRVVAA